MSLSFGPSPPELAGELSLVRRSAEAFASALGKANALPPDFPKLQMVAFAMELAELPSASALTAWHALELADTRLPELRSAHFPPEPPPGAAGDGPPTPARGEGVDRELSDLITTVSTALRVARRLAAKEPDRQPPDPSVDRPANGELAAVEAKGARAARDIDAARDAFDASEPPALPAAQDFRLALTDAKVLTGLGRVELAQRQIIPAWLKRLGGWLADYPSRIAQAGRALKQAVETAKGFHGVWRRYEDKLIDVHYESAREFAEELEKTGERLGDARKSGKPDEAFSISKMRAKLVAGERLPKSWVGSVDELDLSHTPLRDLSAFADLTSLRSLTSYFGVESRRRVGAGATDKSSNYWSSLKRRNVRPSRLEHSPIGPNRQPVRQPPGGADLRHGVRLSDRRRRHRAKTTVRT